MVSRRRMALSGGIKIKPVSHHYMVYAYRSPMHLTVVVADESSGIFGNGASGLLGLGRRAGNDSFIETVFRNHRAWQNFTIGLELNNPNDVDPSGAVKSAGAMDVRGTDTQYNGQITFNPIVVASTDDIPSNYPSAWSLKLDSWSATADGWTVGRNTGGVAVVETSITDIRFPYEEAEAFCASWFLPFWPFY